MDVYILDSNYKILKVIDSYTSFIWTERYSQCGDTELYLPATKELVQFFKPDQFISVRNSKEYMVIEQIEVNDEYDSGEFITVRGRTLSSILDRRIIWDNTKIKGSLQDGIKSILMQNIIAPGNGNRTIPRFVFKASSDPRITGITVDTEFTGDSVYDAIQSMCEEKDIGFRVLPTSNRGFEFELYAGVDRTYSQKVVLPVMFSSGFDNLRGNTFVKNMSEYKNTALVTNGGRDKDARSTEVSIDKTVASGLKRRETYFSASGIEAVKDKDGNPQYDDAYMEKLKSKGKEELSKSKNIEMFEGEIENNVQYLYGKDYFLGDIVDLRNDYGLSAKTRVSEMVISDDDSGMSITPTFVNIKSET